MIGDSLLNETDKLEMINLGSSTKINYSNNSNFYHTKVLEALKQNKNVIFSSGLEMHQERRDDATSCMSFTEPFILMMRKYESRDYLMIQPFNPKSSQKINKFYFHLDKWEISAEKEGISLRDGITGVIGIESLCDNSNPNKIMILNNLVKSEIHKEYLGQFAQMYDLTFKDYSEQRQGNMVFYKQLFSTKLGRELVLTLPRRRGEKGRFPQQIELRVDNDLTKKLTSSGRVIFFENTFKFDDGIKQTSYLDDAMQIVSNN